MSATPRVRLHHGQGADTFVSSAARVIPTPTRPLVISNATVSAIQRTITKVVGTAVRKGAMACQDADDFRQDLWVEVLQRWPRYDSRVSFEEAFAKLLIEHAMVDCVRRTKTARRCPKAPVHVITTSFIDGDDELLSSRLTDQPQWELGEDLTTSMTALTPKEAELFRRLAGTTISALARELNIPRSTLSDRIQRLRRRLRRALRAYDHEAD